MTKLYGTPGPRLIYPELCTSPSLGRCGVLAMALWPRLIAMADDQGRLAGDADAIRVACFPKSLHRVSAKATVRALAELEAEGHVRLYDVAGEPYLQLEHWWTWQQGMRRAYPSRWPAPDGWEDRVFGRYRDDADAADTPSAAGSGGSQLDAANRLDGRVRTPPRTPPRAGASRAAARRPARTEDQEIISPRATLGPSAVRSAAPTALGQLLPPPPGYSRRQP